MKILQMLQVSLFSHFFPPTEAFYLASGALTSPSKMKVALPESQRAKGCLVRKPELLSVFAAFGRFKEKPFILLMAAFRIIFFVLLIAHRNFERSCNRSEMGD